MAADIAYGWHDWASQTDTSTSSGTAYYESWSTEAVSPNSDTDSYREPSFGLMDKFWSKRDTESPTGEAENPTDFYLSNSESKVSLTETEKIADDRNTLISSVVEQTV